jgi:hypothetical protein
MKANLRMNDFEAVMYPPSAGGYIPHIKLKADIINQYGGNQAKGLNKWIRKEYTNEIKALQKFGINSDGREMYNTNNPRVVANKTEAEILFNQYNAIITYLQLATTIKF